MKLFNYKQFLNDEPLNENLDKAKKFLKDRYLISKAAGDLKLIDTKLADDLKHGDKRTITFKDFSEEDQSKIKLKLRELKLSDEQVRSIERDPEFMKIREIVKDNLGYTYAFTYFYYVEMLSIEELTDIYNKIIEYRGLLDKLPKKFDNNFIDPNIPNNAEVLIDGFGILEEYRKVRKILDTFTSRLKAEYAKASEATKQQISEIAVGFDNVKADKKEKIWRQFFGEMKVDTSPTLPNGNANPNFNKEVWSSSLKRFENTDNPLRELIKAAKNHLKSSENDNIIAFYDKISDCNMKYGARGTETILDENGILIIEVKSFQANQFLNGHTRHCIKDSESQWNSYVANHYNKQYYLYNFNINQTDNTSVIGVTIAPFKSGTSANYCDSKHTSEIYGTYGRACHQKNDGNVASEFKSILTGWSKTYNLGIDIFDTCLKAMSPVEIAKREKAKIAEREIVKKGLTIEQINGYVKEDGADINKDNCVALLHAVEENDIEKVNAILALGGNPNLRGATNKSESIINKAKDIDMIKLLVSNDCDLTGEVFGNICDDVEAVDYCLKHGLDPDFDNSLPIRRCCRGSWKKDGDIGVGYFEVFKLLLKHGAKLSDDNGRNMSIKWAAEYCRLDFIDYIIEKHGIDVAVFKDAIGWVFHSRKAPEHKDKTIKYLQDKIDSVSGSKDKK